MSSTPYSSAVQQAGPGRVLPSCTELLLPPGWLMFLPSRATEGAPRPTSVLFPTALQGKYLEGSRSLSQIPGVSPDLHVEQGS